jgi:tetratricopeptide (TPR) repeat protein
MAISAISRPVGKRISCKHFFESMKLILVAFILLLALMTSAQCQPTVALNGKGNALPLFFNETTTYTFIKDIGRAEDVELIKVHFKNAFRGADQNVATVDRIWQVSDTNSSQVIINDSNEKTITSGTPLKLEEGYELAIKSIDIDGNKVFMELSKNGEVIDSRIIIQNPWYNKGIALDKLEKYDEAIKSYNKAIKLNANVSTSIIDKGNSHYNAGEYVAAIRYYDEAIKQDPKDEYAWYNKAMALRMLHRDSEAKAAYTKARELGYSGTMTLMEMTA